jgi:hypothetical protein
MNLNVMAKEIHKNAIAHGWWDKKRDAEEILALIHSEWSEALEEYRSGKPLVYTGCGLGFACTDAEFNGLACPERTIDAADAGILCEHSTGKPEGISVELIDGCIRILDYIRKLGYVIPGRVNTAEGIIAMARQNAMCTTKRSIPALVCHLHFCTSAYVTAKSKDEACLDLLEAVGIAFSWIQDQGLDPMSILIEKGEYNKTRSYRHGGKLC